MAENDEIIALLREIRDLEKARFERYEEVTSAALQRAAETQKKLTDLRETAEQRRVEANQNLGELRRSIGSSSVFWVNTIFQVVLILTLWYMILRR